MLKEPIYLTNTVPDTPNFTTTTSTFAAVALAYCSSAVFDPLRTFQGCRPHSDTPLDAALMWLILSIPPLNYFLHSLLSLHASTDLSAGAKAHSNVLSLFWGDGGRVAVLKCSPVQQIHLKFQAN